MNGDGPQQAVVLSGGGAYAAYEVGVMKALFAGQSPSTRFQPLDPDYIVGSSAGAMNAMAVVAHDHLGLVESVQHLEHVWLNRIAEDTQRCGNGVYRIRGLPAEFLDPTCYGTKPFGLFRDVAEDVMVLLRGTLDTGVGFLRSSEPLLQRIVRSLNLSAFVSTEPFLESLRTFIPTDGVRRSRHSLRIVGTNLNTGELTVFTERDVDQFGYGPLLASTALPVFFPPVEFGGYKYVDGSTLAHTPLLPAIAEAETLHVVYMDPDVTRIPAERFQNTVDIIDRTLVVHFAYSFNRDIKLAMQINQALELLQNYRAGERLSPMQIHTFLHMAARIDRRIVAGRPYKPLTIHRYHPRDDLGESLGLMNLNYEKLQRVIQRGYIDTVNHDCTESGCVMAGASMMAESPPMLAPSRQEVPVDPPIRTPDPPTTRIVDMGKPPANDRDEIRTPRAPAIAVLEEIAAGLSETPSHLKPTIERYRVRRQGVRKDEDGGHIGEPTTR
ncbi:MAG TPA: patatin-like phospholipase family protein [Pirellulaceae bacterium]|nr:patatin-like phospholipase family protein [Pirellulaceae bacterium]